MKKDNDRKIIGVQVPNFLLEPLEKEAEDLCISVSAMIRLILNQRYNPKIKTNAKLNDGGDK